jgi:hypothetical protein
MLNILPPVYRCAEFDYTECCSAKCSHVCAIKTTAIVLSGLLSIVIHCVLLCCPYARCRYAWYVIQFVVMLRVIVLAGFMLSVVILNAIILGPILYNFFVRNLRIFVIS